MAGSDLVKFYTSACEKLASLEKEKGTLLKKRNDDGTAMDVCSEGSSSSENAAAIRAHCVRERFQQLEQFHNEFRLIEQQLKQRLAYTLGDGSIVMTEIMHWKKRLLTRSYVWQSAITHDHWYFTSALIHLYIDKTCKRHPLCGVESHLKPLVDPSEQDPSKWEAAMKQLCDQDPMQNLLFVATQVAEPLARYCPVGSYSGIYATRVSQLLGHGRQIKRDGGGAVSGGLTTFIRLFGADAQAAVIRFVVICNMENNYILIDFSQSQASRDALQWLFRSPSIEKVVWNKHKICKALQDTLWIDPASFNEIYDLAAPWTVESGKKHDDIHYVTEVSEYFKLRSPPTATDLALSDVAGVLFHTKELGEIGGSSIIDVKLNDRSEWVTNDALVGWGKIDPRIFVSLVVTATTVADIAVATAILNPGWRMGLASCPSTLAMAVERFLNTAAVPAPCVAKVMEKAELPLPKCRYNADCIYDLVQQGADTSTNATSSSPSSKAANERALSDIQTQIDAVYKQKIELERAKHLFVPGDNAITNGSAIAATVPTGTSSSSSRISEPLLTRPEVPCRVMPLAQPTTSYNRGFEVRSKVPTAPFVPLSSLDRLTSTTAAKPEALTPQRNEAYLPPSQHLSLLPRPATTMMPSAWSQNQQQPIPSTLPKYTDDAVSSRLKEVVPLCAHQYIIPRYPLTSELDEDWATVPVPRLTFPVYLRTLHPRDPLNIVLNRWRRDYRVAFLRWSTTEPWSRMPVFLGALATEAQLTACRVIKRWTSLMRKMYPPLEPNVYPKAAFIGLLIEFCVYVEQISHLRAADNHKKHEEQEAKRKERLIRLMNAALEDKKRERAKFSSSSKRDVMSSKRNVMSSIKTSEVYKNMAGTSADQVPLNFLLLLSTTDPRPFDISPGDTFVKLREGHYLARTVTDAKISPYIGPKAHPLCSRLPAQIIPLSNMLSFIRNNPQRYEYQQYEPFVKLKRLDAGDRPEYEASFDDLDDDDGLREQQAFDDRLVKKARVEESVRVQSKGLLDR